MKSVLITGASGGIGSAAAELFAQAGYAVCIHYCRGKRAAEALAEKLTRQGAEAFAVQADLTEEAEAARLVETAEKRMCGLSVLINNAGEAYQGLLSDMTAAEWRRVIAVNLDAAFYCTRAAIPGMVRRQSGRIINVSSVWGLCGASCEAAYSAAKAGVIGLTKALAKELAPSGITVNCVAPGVIDTRMNAAFDRAALEEDIPLGRLGTPAEAAAALLFLASEQGAYFTGQVISPNGGAVI